MLLLFFSSLYLDYVERVSCRYADCYLSGNPSHPSGECGAYDVGSSGDTSKRELQWFALRNDSGGVSNGKGTPAGGDPVQQDSLIGQVAAGDGFPKAADLVYVMLRDLAHEEVWVAYLTSANTVISVEMVFKGSVDNVLISQRVILAKALSLDATNIILYHNHPSGSVMPSPSDIKMTANLK